MKTSKRIFLAVATMLLIVNGCAEDEKQNTRTFYLGFTPFPYDDTQEAVSFVYDKIATDADIVNHHFDDGVPWVEALADSEFHQEIKNDWTYRKANTPANHIIYVSVTPQNFFRDGLAPYRSSSPNLPLPSPWDTYRFNHVDVKTAYLRYCERIIDFFQPAYFNMAIEANLLHVKNPTLWNDYMELHQHVYEALKLKYGHLTVFCSISGATLLEGFTEDDHEAERQVVEHLMQYSDLYALSFYPYMSAHLGNPYPATTFDDLFSISSKPLAIAETGYPAQSFSIETGNGLVTISGSQDKQDNYIQNLLDACNRRKALFVINFVLRDYDQLWKKLGSPQDIGIAWRDNGLYDEDGNQRQAYTTWKNYLKRSRE